MLKFSLLPARRPRVEYVHVVTASAWQAAKEEPIADFEFCFAFEAEEPSKHRLQELMWEEMRRYHPEQGPWRGTKGPAAAGQLASSPRCVFSIRTNL